MPPEKNSLLDTMLAIASDWLITILAVGGAVAVATGFFDSELKVSLHPYLLLITCLVAALADTVRRIKGWTPPRFPKTIEGPLLWTVIAWMTMRSLPQFSSHTLMIPALLIAWIVASTPVSIFIFPLIAGLAMECGLLVSGLQDLPVMGLNLALYALSALGLSFFAHSRVYQRKLRKAIARDRQEADTKEYGADMGLFIKKSLQQNSAPQTRDNDSPAPFSQPTVETVANSFDLQMEIIRQALDATTVALLWPDQNGQELRLRNIATTRHDSDLNKGPYPMGSGITGALQQTKGEIAIAPAGRSFPDLPYYKKSAGVGSLLAREIKPDRLEDGAQQTSMPGILCVDRKSEAEWTEEDREFLRLSVRKLFLELNMGRRLINMDNDRHTMQQLYNGLRELNGVLGLEASFDATIKTIKSLVQADLVAISLSEEKVHRIARADGPQADNLVGLAFARDEGLVGQVLKFNHSLPAKAEYQGPAPVFSNNHRLKGFRSLLIVPLRKEKNNSIGTLTVAAKSPGVFTRARQDILELIAGQIAVKIDLAQAHEKINKMATTDGLTGLANHRTFQHAFDVMLNRAERRQSLLCMLLCDIDHFKGINDTFGHPFGDHVLQEVSKTLSDTVRKVDLAARYGGEEFAIILEDSGQEGGWQMAERIRQAIESLQLSHNNEPVHISISLGLAAYPHDGANKNILIANADQALYKAKRTGRNRAVAWSKIAGKDRLPDSPAPDMTLNQ